jgi:multiple sugar transport system permease protein/sn-glycerol 3-phosphate transport system permease protein
MIGATNFVKKRLFPWRVQFTSLHQEYLIFLILVLPNLTLFAIWTYWPFIQSIYLSFTNWNPLNPVKTFVGLDNYIRLFTQPIFWQVLFNTVVFTVGVLTIRLTLSLGLAVLLNQKLAALGFWRLIYFSPHITTSAAMALVWLTIYDPVHGPLQAIFEAFGAEFPNVLDSTLLALPALMVVDIWRGLGYSTIVFLAAMQGVDREIKDAAEVDGANGWQMFRHITLPAISPVTYFLIVTGLIGLFRTFNLVQIMTGGRPLNATNLYVFYLYREAFHFQKFGYASAVAVVMVILIMAFTYLQTRAAEKWVHY